MNIKTELPCGKVVGTYSKEFQPEVVCGLAPHLLGRLNSGATPALHMVDAIDKKWCDQVNTAFSNHADVKQEGVNPVILSLGQHLYACGSGTTIECYFDKLEASNKAMREILPDGVDPLVDFLKNGCNLSNAEYEALCYNGIAVEHGTLRLWGQGDGKVDKCQPKKKYFALPHEDYEETNASHPMLSQIQGTNNIFSIILCIDAVPGREPTTILWDKRMTLDDIRDPQYRNQLGTYGFDEKILHASAVTAIQLKKGDMAVIPAHAVHAVVGYEGMKRSTYMAFFHFVKSKDGTIKKIIFRT